MGHNGAISDQKGFVVHHKSSRPLLLLSIIQPYTRMPIGYVKPIEFEVRAKDTSLYSIHVWALKGAGATHACYLHAALDCRESRV